MLSIFQALCGVTLQLQEVKSFLDFFLNQQIKVKMILKVF